MLTAQVASFKKKKKKKKNVPSLGSVAEPASALALSQHLPFHPSVLSQHLPFHAFGLSMHLLLFFPLRCRSAMLLCRRASFLMPTVLSQHLLFFPLRFRSAMLLCRRASGVERDELLLEECAVNLSPSLPAGPCQVMPRG